MPLISDAIEEIRKPGVVDNDARLREILNGIFKAGREQFARNEKAARDEYDRTHGHGMIMFNDGSVASIL